MGTNPSPPSAPPPTQPSSGRGAKPGPPPPEYQFQCGASAGGIERSLLAKAKAFGFTESGREHYGEEQSKRTASYIPGRYAEYQLVPLVVFIAMLLLWIHATYTWGFLTTLFVASGIIVVNLQVAVSNMTDMESRPRLSHLSILCLPATVFGSCIGLILTQGYFYSYQAFLDRMQYVKIHADHPASGLHDAAGITFETDVGPDLSMVVGLKSGGTTYCVAPIIKKGTPPSSQPPVQFWAVGIDCCEYRYKFQCGDVSSSTARGGVVIHDYSAEIMELLPMNSPEKFYRKALDVATSLYPVSTDSKEAILLSWTENATDDSGIWYEGFYNAMAASFCFVFFIFPVAFILSSQHQMAEIQAEDPVAESRRRRQEELYSSPGGPM
ncbi:unnamed protein product [Amoebophrya sp. A25]|nr:unnamed protein product [Amoebophrya sp. A25]|eukprot:GSA25T00013775001.1